MTTTVAFNSDHALAQAGLLSCDGNLIDRFMRRFAKGVKNITARFGRMLPRKLPHSTGFSGRAGQVLTESLLT